MLGMPGSAKRERRVRDPRSKSRASKEALSRLGFLMFDAPRGGHGCGAGRM